MMITGRGSELLALRESRLQELIAGVGAQLEAGSGPGEQSKEKPLGSG